MAKADRTKARDGPLAFRRSQPLPRIALIPALVITAVACFGAIAWTIAYVETAAD
jgi:hypothetical protein